MCMELEYTDVAGRLSTHELEDDSPRVYTSLKLGSSW